MGLAYRDRHSLALFVLLSIGLTQWPSTSFAGCEHVMEIAFSPPWLSDYWREETPRQINISSGIPRGGYGDIAPNLLMARRLREALPSVVKIQVVVERFAEDHVRNLIAEYQGQALKIDGIDYLPEAQARPDLLRSDFALVFSSANGPGNGNSGRLDADAGPKAGTPFDPSVLPDAQRLPFIYSRFGLSFTEPVTAIRSPVRFSDERSERPAKENFLRFSAGAGNFGFYVRPSSQPGLPPMNREKVIEVLNELQPKDQQVMSLSKDSALAFAYSFYRDATQLYLDVLRETFKDPRYLASGHPQRPVVIVVKYFPGLNLSGFPSWVTILSPKQRSFLLDESLIAHADFPVMVTGDTSLSLAMEYGKPAFLEVPRWKIRSIPQLIDHLAQQNSEYFSDPNHMKQLRRALGVMAFENIATEGRGQSMQNPKFWLELLLDPVFLQAQSQAFFQAKASMSLLEKSLRFMEYMESQPLSPDLSRDELSQLFLNI